MKLEDLPGTLTELKEQLCITIREESAVEANELLLTELRKRIMLEKHAPIGISEKTTNNKLNEQQSKFLKHVPAIKTTKEIPVDAIQVQKSSGGYTIGIDSLLSPRTKERVKVTESDIQQYLNTITTNLKNT